MLRPAGRLIVYGALLRHRSPACARLLQVRQAQDVQQDVQGAELAKHLGLVAALAAAVEALVVDGDDFRTLQLQAR